MKLRHSLAAIALAVVALLHVLVPATASQGSGCMPTTGTVSGLTLVQDINAGLAAIISSNSGSSAPATDCSGAPVKGQPWLDTSVTPNHLRLYDGTNWLDLGAVDATNHIWTPPVGGGTATVASASTADLCSVPQGVVSLSGTTAITSFGSSCPTGVVKVLRIPSAGLVVTYNGTTLLTPTAGNITSQAGDAAIAVALGSGAWQVMFYQRADGTPLTNTAFGAVTTLASATTTDLGTIASRNVSITGTTAITGFGSSASVNYPLYHVCFTGALTLTYNATSLILPGGANITTAAGDCALADYLGSGNWRVTVYQTASGTAIVPTSVGTATATHLVITNDGTTPNSKINITANSMTFANASNVLVSANSVSTQVNLAVSGAGGMDTGSRPTGAATWLYIWGINNGTTVSAIASLSATAPTLPGGYSYKIYLGAVRVDSSAPGVLLRTIQTGSRAQYTAVASTNTAALPVMASGTSGNTWVTGNNFFSFLAVSVSSFVPPTATEVRFVLFANYQSATASHASLAPNNSYKGPQSTTNPSPFNVDTSAYNISVSGTIILESTNIYFATDGAGGAVLCFGWIDGGVNAS